jgi:hypothetical protein
MVRGGASVEIVIFVLALVLLGVSAQVYGSDSRPAEPEREKP